jgi:uncharacterized iron-regulated membrane protein
MRRIRPVLFWFHLVAGVSAGLVILIMSATGAALALQPQILAVLERDVRTVEPPAGASRVGAGALLAAARDARPSAVPVSMTIDADPQLAASVSFGRDGIVYVDPYSARVLGGGAASARAVFQSLTEWHRWLAASGDARPAARAVTGGANLLFALLATSGLVLWWPRNWSWRAVKANAVFQRTRTARARDFNWHNVIGFWSAPVLIVLTTTAIVMSYPWANALVYRLAGTPLPQAASNPAPRSAPASPSGGAISAVPPPEVLDAAWTRAAGQLPTWKSMTLRLPSRADAPLTFSIVDNAYWNAYARSTVTVDAKRAEILRWDPYTAASRGQKLRGWIRFAHTGELGGVAAQTIAGVACLGGVFLVWTGLSLALRRLAASRVFRGARIGPAQPASSPMVDAR